MKYTITVEETLKYDRDIIVDIPDDVSEDELDDILDRCQSQANIYEDFSSIYEQLESGGIKILEYADDDTHYPKRTEFEVYDVIQGGAETENDTDEDEDEEDEDSEN